MIQCSHICVVPQGGDTECRWFAARGPLPPPLAKLRHSQQGEGKWRWCNKQPEREREREREMTNTPFYSPPWAICGSKSMPSWACRPGRGRGSLQMRAPDQLDPTYRCTSCIIPKAIGKPITNPDGAAWQKQVLCRCNDAHSAGPVSDD